MSGNRDQLIRLDDSRRLISNRETDTIFERILSLAQGGGYSHGGLVSWWTGELRWGRNRVSLASDRRDLALLVFRMIDNSEGGVSTNQLDDVSIESAIRAAERMAQLRGSRDLSDFPQDSPAFEYPKTAIWSDTTYNLTTEARAEIARTVLDPAEKEGMLAAGYLEMRAQEIAGYSSKKSETLPYVTVTQAQCSMTVRDSHGTGSGWAGVSGYDWSAIDPAALATRALEKALASRNPVALEPGRYTVILEPQAVHDLITLLIGDSQGGPLYRQTVEKGGGPFALGEDAALGLWRTKLGLKVIDERVTIEHDPTDPLLGVIPMDYQYDRNTPFRPVKWIDHGVLKNLWERRSYALATRGEDYGHPNSFSFRMSGGDTSMDEMIQTTKRGLLVTRFSNVSILDGVSMLATGVTRDGLWLIENGKISKAVKNFRFTESPLFVLNSLEQLGMPVPVFRPYGQVGITPAIVPPVKARDFSFTSTIDAI